MSDSLQDSSKHNYEETDDMLMESISEKKRENEYTVSDEDEDEENEDTDDRVNNYEYDDFVVPDDFNEETDELEGTDKSSSRRRKRRKREYKLDKEDTELLEQNFGSSTEGYRRLRKVKRSDTEEDDILEDDGDLSSSYQRDKKMQSYDDLKLINQIFHNETEGEDGDRFMGEEGEEMDIERGNQLKGYFQPEEIQERFLEDSDKVIIEKDEPERLQVRFKNRPMPDNPELIEETNWLVEKIMIKNGITSKDTVNLKSKVHKVLELLRLAGCEIMYIWTHKKHEVTSDRRMADKHEYELKLSDLWYIYDLDLEWMHIYKLRRNIQSLMTKLESFYQVTNNIKNSFRSCYDLSLLKYYLDYVTYQLKKHVDDQEISHMMVDEPDEYESKAPKQKRIRSRNFSREVMKHGLHEVGNNIFITPDQMAENIIVGEQRFRPKIINDTPDKVAKENSNPSVPMIGMPVETLTTLCRFTALELFYHPIIRKNLRRLYTDKVLIFTDPTPKGAKEITIYDFYYPVKRIRGKKPAEFSGELWMIALEAQRKGLITISFRLPWEEEEKKDEIRNRLLDLYLLEAKNSSGNEELNTINAWNIVREEAISKLLKGFIYPSMEDSVKSELEEASEKFIISECSKSFKESINVQPYKKTLENGEADYASSELKVLSCVAEDNYGPCFFVIVDENGELRDQLELPNIGKFPGDDFSKRNIYDREKDELKKFMARNYPDVIVVGATSLSCQQIRMELDNIASEVFDEFYAHMEMTTIRKPFVMWGINTVPKAFSKSYRADRDLIQFASQVREALSLARMVQDPLAETLSLWNENPRENSLLDFNFHTMQHMVNRAKLKNEYEKIAMEVCNNVGVDINKVIKHRHLASTLQFIAGLGPRKASDLMNKIDHQLGQVNMRKDLFPDYLEKTVFINCIGFIKVLTYLDYRDHDLNRNYDVLDSTRIHPDFYQMATKIAKEALDDPSESIDPCRALMENPKKLQELDLEDYAKHLRQRGKFNMMVLIELVVQELTHPFQDPRSEFKTKMRKEDLFYTLTKESKFVLREEAIISVRITRVDQKAVRVVTDSGIPGIIMLADLKDKVNDIKEGDIGKYYDVNEYLRAKVRIINYDQVRLKLSTKNEDLVNHRDFMKKNAILDKYGLSENYNFAVKKDEDYPSISVDAFKRPSRYIPRKIKHPRFKNISLTAAQEYLQDREIGDFVIRPSSKGLKYLNITWKISSDNIAHLEIKEGMKGPNDIISKHLTLDKDTYESLDEIIERYIKPCNNLVGQIRENKKFMDYPIDRVKETLIEEKKNDSSLIPYYISFTPEVPQYLILSYIPKHFDIKHEYIKIKPEALHFHDLKFASIKRLVSWFKSQLKTSEYQKYLENTIPLFDISGKKQQYEDIKREAKDRRRKKESVRKVPRRKDSRKAPGSTWDDNSVGGWDDYPKENRTRRMIDF